MGLDMYLNSREGYEMGYWRKANQVHGYIVDNFAEGRDNCQEIELTREKLEQLQKDCRAVLGDMSKAMELLPPTEGFFFGSYELDEFYREDLYDTIAIIDKCLATEEEIFIYQASW